MKRSGKMQDQEGFYHYQDGEPEFQREDFLAAVPDISLKDFGRPRGDKETDHYIELFTAVMLGLLEGALTLYVNGIANLKDIDQVWAISSHRGWGCFRTIHKIGTQQVYEVFKAHYEKQRKHGDLEQRILAALQDGTFPDHKQA